MNGKEIKSSLLGKENVGYCNCDLAFVQDEDHNVQEEQNPEVGEESPSIEALHKPVVDQTNVIILNPNKY